MFTSQWSLELRLSRWLWFTDDRRRILTLKSLQFPLSQLSWTFALFSTFWKDYLWIHQRVSIDLSEFRFVISRVRVDVVRLKVLSVDKTSRCWSSISIAIGMEGWFAEVSSHRTIREQPTLSL